MDNYGATAGIRMELWNDFFIYYDYMYYLADGEFEFHTLSMQTLDFFHARFNVAVNTTTTPTYTTHHYIPDSPVSSIAGERMS